MYICHSLIKITMMNKNIYSMVDYLTDNRKPRVRANSEELVEGLEALIKNEQLRSTLSFNAFKQLERFSPDAMMDAYLLLYRTT